MFTFQKTFFLIILGFFSFNFQAQDIPFNCDYNAYLFQFNDVYAIDLASGNSYLVHADITPGSINAAAYNPADGYIWGSLSEPEKSIVRIGKNFTTTTFYIDELPNTNRYVGDISSEGIYYLKGGGATYYKIDLNPESNQYTQFQSAETLSQSLNVHDWAFNAVDGQLYTVEKYSNILYRINPSNGNVTSLGIVPILSGLGYTYGAVYFDVSGRFYISANETGTIYMIQSVQNLTTSSTIVSNLFAFGPSSSSNDGARCPTAPVPQEICDNGIDDDGDGLIDCEDPSCSGYGVCDVIIAPTSSGNTGGLESNNRLSEQISQRNFNRAKTGYKFQTNKAKRITANEMSFERLAINTMTLQDFIPLGNINEDEVIESTPADLVSITNATQIFSVDYLRNNQTVASILALKTENGVYEHTKYICDRLLGAELLSVSTMEINGETFLKSIIRNENGGNEFVLSFAAREINNNENFAIENHWNLDQYTQNTTFYNFQIWSNSIDDLYLLGQEVLNLIEMQKPIVDFSHSNPPPVFVKKGNYAQGVLNLEIVNTNNSNAINLESGFRETETSAFDSFSSSISLSGYLTNVSINTGNLFDIGFRIIPTNGTPDDLFLSDGPWGIDASQTNTFVNNYSVLLNENTFSSDEFPLERNVVLNATTSSYVAVYRALTPRFQAVDLSEYEVFLLNAKGSGMLEITFVKASVTDWQNQPKVQIALTENFQEFIIPLSGFQSQSFDVLLDDVVTVVFTLVAENGQETDVSMHLNHLRFSQNSLLTTNIFPEVTESLLAIPNPMSEQTMLQFDAQQQEVATIMVYDLQGKCVFRKSLTTNVGKNQTLISNLKITSGLYIVQITGTEAHYKPLKLLVR